MTKSELIELLALKQTHLMQKDVELAVKVVLDQISAALCSQERIEIRGFGSFALRRRPPRVGRNPKNGEAVVISAKHVPHFRPGKALRERVAAPRSDDLPGMLSGSPPADRPIDLDLGQHQPGCGC